MFWEEAQVKVTIPTAPFTSVLLDMNHGFHYYLHLCILCLGVL